VAQDTFHVAELWRVGYRPLYFRIGERFLLILFASGITDIFFKTQYIKKKLRGEVLWLSRQIQGMRWIPQDDVLACCLETMGKLFGMRKRRDNVVVLTVHAATSHAAPEKIKRLIPGVRTIAYMYDFMDLFVPVDKIKIWEEFHGGKTQADMEYAYIQKIRKGETVDGLIYKDYGPNWNHIEECHLPKLWMPQSVPESMFMKPPPRDIPDSFLFIGTIVPKETHGRPSMIFDDIMMETIFNEVHAQGYPIHAYVLNPDTRVLTEYAEIFAGKQVNLFRGESLDKLIPRTAGRYRWGWMMYHYPQPMIMPMVKISIPTKFWTYAALGIPPVVSEEMEAVAKLVRQYKCGVVVTQDEIQDLKATLDKYNWDELVANLVRMRKKFSLDVYMPQFVNMIKRVMRRPAVDCGSISDDEARAVWSYVPESVLARPSALVRGRETGIRSAGV